MLLKKSDGGTGNVPRPAGRCNFSAYPRFALRFPSSLLCLEQRQQGVTLRGCLKNIHWLLKLWRLLSGELSSNWLILLCLSCCNDVPDLDELLDGWVDLKQVMCFVKCLCMVILLQLSIKQELKLSEPAVQLKKDKKAVKDLMVCPKKKKRKQRSPAKVQVKINSILVPSS